MPFREIPGFSQNNQGGAKCTLCGQHARIMPGTDITARTFATGVHIHMEGPLEVCEVCLLEGGRRVGMVMPEVTETLKGHLATLEGELQRLEAGLEAKTGAVALLAKELTAAEDTGAAKAAASYDRGYDDGYAEGLEREPHKDLEVEEPDFAGGGA